jgi:hypothetical protein
MSGCLDFLCASRFNSAPLREIILVWLYFHAKAQSKYQSRQEGKSLGH